MRVSWPLRAVLTGVLGLLFVQCGSDDGGGNTDATNDEAAAGEGGQPSTDGGATGGAVSTPDSSMEASPDPLDAAADLPSIDSGLGDDTPPDLRTVLASIDGPLAQEVDLSRSDATHVLPVPANAEFTVFAHDGETTSALLVVEVVDGEGNVVTPSSVEFSSGLWRITVPVARGQSFTLRVVDEAGNAALSNALVLPSAEEALVGEWETRFSDPARDGGAPEPTFSHSWNTTFTMAAWEEARDDTGFVHGGAYTVSGDELRLQETFSQNGPPNDSDTSTVEWERRAVFYLDGDHFSDRPYQRVAGTTGIRGTWTRSWALYLPSGGSLELSEEITETLELRSDDTWVESRSGTGYGADGGTAIDEVRSGTFWLESAGSYTTGTTFFIGRTVTEVNGQPVTEPQSFEVYALRGPFLLLSPARR